MTDKASGLDVAYYNAIVGFIWSIADDCQLPLRKNMGKKNCGFTPEIRAEILRLFMKMRTARRARFSIPDAWPKSPRG